MSDIDKSYIEAPDLPNIVQGDGRYLMTQLRRYLAAMAEQVNLANGFSANEEIGTSGLSPPANFTLTFSVEGGVFKWSDPSYYNKLAWYEVRTNTAVGTQAGLLERTVNNYSTVMPTTSVGTVYLYAVLQDGTASNGSALNYSKKRPEKPQDINLSKNAQGTLINYTFIPLDCIGAHVYINGIMYEVQDNWMLYTAADTINEVAVAYYDCFGEGEKAYLTCVIPQVTGFTVERNGAVLDFYWNKVSVNGVNYVVRASTTPTWENGIEIFKTGLLKKKMEYPQTGDVYFLIKAYDEHNNFSSDATWYLLTTVQDQQKNIIVDFDEHSALYTGNKVGTYYDAEANGIRLSEGSFQGEYISAGHLPYEARARSWVEYRVEGVDNTDLIIADLDFSINDEKATTTTMVGGTLSNFDGTEITTYIADKSDKTDALMEASLDGSTLTSRDEEPTEAIHCDTYEYARWLKGVRQDELTRLQYSLGDGLTTLSLTFNVKLSKPIDRCTLAIISGETDSLMVEYDNGFYLTGTDGTSIFVKAIPQATDIVSIGVSQTETERTLFIKLLNAIVIKDDGNTLYKTIKAPPVGTLTTVQFNR